MDFLDSHISNLALIALYSTLSFGMAMVLTPLFFTFLRTKVGKQIRDAGPDGKDTPLFTELHKSKAGTPTMGGIVIWGTTLFMVLVSFLFEHFGWINNSLFSREETYLPLFALAAAGVLGAVDDWFNITQKGKHKGIKVRPKLFWLTMLAVAGAWWFHWKLGIDTVHVPGLQYFFPWLPQSDFVLGWWYLPLFVLVLISTTNAVNITDGLDGLAAGLLILALTGFGLIAFAKGMMLLTTLCGVVIGALAAFLWWNVHPARLFMGDTGSLALGAFLAVIALLLDSVLILPIIGLVFVVETLSVIIQMLSKKFLHRKVFLIAPLHHHFEKIGWAESQVVARFWIIGGVCAVFGSVLGVLGLGQ